MPKVRKTTITVTVAVVSLSSCRRLNKRESNQIKSNQFNSIQNQFIILGLSPRHHRTSFQARNSRPSSVTTSCTPNRYHLPHKYPITSNRPSASCLPTNSRTNFVMPADLFSAYALEDDISSQCHSLI